MRTLALSLLAFACVLPLQAQYSAADFRELGTFPSRIFTSTDYEAHPQNWIILSDSLGHVYAGNSNGMLHFDGASWRLYRLPNPSMIRALVIFKGKLLTIKMQDSSGIFYILPGGGQRHGETLREGLMRECLE
ncbi:MAG: hypothetical protein AAGJ10_13715, partial [Bacteroidota bacterium]